MIVEDIFIQRPQKNELTPLLNKIDKNEMIMVEIGCYAGESAEQFIASGKVKRIYCIDPFLKDYDLGDPASGTNFDKVLSLFNEMVERNKDKCEIIIIKEKSDDAIKYFKENNILVDFVYIDGNHQYEAVKSDILNYIDILKDDGVIAGHDYGHLGAINAAVNEVFGAPSDTFTDSSWIIYNKSKRII